MNRKTAQEANVQTNSRPRNCYKTEAKTVQQKGNDLDKKIQNGKTKIRSYNPIGHLYSRIRPARAQCDLFLSRQTAARARPDKRLKN